jgi:hypothetical protein
MTKKFVSLSTVAGIAIGVTLFGVVPAYADLPTVDVLVDGAVKALENAVVSALGDVVSSITGLQTSLTQTLNNGFTQNANYSKAQIGAHQQITDASNTVMARFALDTRARQIVDEHVASPVHCDALNNGAAVVVSSAQSWKTAQSMENVSDPRGEAFPNQPAYFGAGQAVQAVNQLHLSRYCSPTESAAGLCSISALPNADQRATSLFATGTYDGQQGVTAANDYATNLIQPVVPASLRGDQLTSVSGQDAAARRREYNARMSLAHNVVDYVIAAQAPSTPLNAQQQQQAQSEGLTPVATASWLEALTLDVDRRYSDANWAGQLQTMPPASVEREVALELAATNYLLLQNYKVGLMNASTAATGLAQQTEKDFPPATQMATPSMSGN